MFFLFKQKTAYEMRISDWSSDVCSSDLGKIERQRRIFGHRCNRLHPGKGLGPGLRLFGSTRPRTVSRNIILQLGALGILRRLGRCKLRHPFSPLSLERVIAARVKRGLAVIEVEIGRAHV